MNYGTRKDGAVLACSIRHRFLSAPPMSYTLHAFAARYERDLDETAERFPIGVFRFSRGRDPAPSGQCIHGIPTACCTPTLRSKSAKVSYIYWRE